MANRTFSVRHGLDVANTIVIDSNRNLSNIATANATTVNATNFLTVAGLNLPNHTNNAYAAANSAANTVRVSQNSGSTLSSKQLNFTNTASILAFVTDSGDGNANIAFTTSGASPGDAYNQANSAYNQANNAYNAANNAGTVQLTYDTTTTSEEVVDSFSTSTYRSAKYQMQIENTYGLQALSIMVLHDGSTTNLIKYGETTIGANVGSFTSDVSGGSVRLKFTATDPTTALTYFRYLLANRFNESIPNDLMTGNGTIDLMQTLLISPSDLNQ